MPVRLDLPLPPARHDEALELLLALDALDVAPVGEGLGAILPGDPDDPTVRAARDGLCAALGVPAVGLSPALPRDDGSTWIVAPRPVREGGVWIVPEGLAVPGAPAVVLADGPAFGTGLHVTTALCLRALEEEATSGLPAAVLDVGTGSGILALAALARGVPRALGVDLDPAAVATARANAHLNGMDDRVGFRVGGPEVVDGRYGLVFANILTGPLLALADPLARRLASGGRLVLSGVRGPFVAEVTRAYRSRGLHPRGVTTAGDWASLSFAPNW